MQSAYHPAFGQVVNYSLTPLPDAPDPQVGSTIQRMRDYARTDAETPRVREESAQMMRRGGGDPNLGVWRTIKPHMKFKRDEKIAADLRAPIDADDVIEVIIRPVDQLWLIDNTGQGVGDCDCFHTLAASLLTAAGVPCSFVTISADDDAPGQFSHVYLASYWMGERTPLDISHADYPGFENPNTGRLKEWPIAVSPEECLIEGVLLGGVLLGGYFLLRSMARGGR